MVQPTNAPTSSLGASIIDIRNNNGTDLTASLAHEIRSGLRPANGGEKRLPTLLLYNQEGLKLFEKVTYLDEYYLTGQELQVLDNYADRIADRVALQPNSMIVELGSGNLRKVRLLLDALEKKGKPVSYYALDLSRSELERTLAEVPEGTFKHVECYGLLGTYDDGLAWLKQSKQFSRPKTILSLGSSIGNFPRKEAADFLRSFADVLSPTDSFLLGVDACTDPDKVFLAYNDSRGWTHDFVLNGLKHANELLGREEFDLSTWKVIGEYDEQAGRHQAFVTPTQDVVVDGVPIQAGERVRIEESYKYTRSQMDRLWHSANVAEGASWRNISGDYGLHLLNRPRVGFPMRAEDYAAHPVPTLDEWEALWDNWDAVTLDMIPKEELMSKPIKLRNACIFYLGHIPTFLDMKLTYTTQEALTEPRHYPSIFERGIDPDVDNPEQCHAHSEIPDEWPPAPEILDFQTRVRMRVRRLYSSGQAFDDRAIGRTLWLGFEHEIMHLETLLYMLIQSDKTQSPPGTIQPDFECLAKQAECDTVPNQWFKIPEQQLTIGLDDPDDNSGPVAYFGWDNEKPSRSVTVPSFQIQARPVTNREYAEYLEQAKKTTLPESWAPSKNAANGTNGHINGPANGTTNGESNGHSGPSKAFLHNKAIRTVYGLVPLEYALDWPVSASYDELAGCAKWMGGRIPTMEEARSVYKYVDELKKLEADQAISQTIPAVNGHLVNDGVEESPPTRSTLNGSSGARAGPDPREVFADCEDLNVGFKHWHPMPVSQNGNKLAGQGGMGGLWEWTSSVLEKYEGFEPMDLYPAYTADFFDHKHNIVLGGSWATHPRVAGRKTFVNWYQRNYPYVWAGARVVKDV